ncbi:hypothetical protein AB0B57_22350 [Micromonospora sp. NPDC049101]|uniref:hypothetical protein n=1 Tax=Micromonospora sp. NPDC049101 TaxID=3155032 RepID=UPI00340708AC
MAIPDLTGFAAGEKVSAAKLNEHTKDAFDKSVFHKPFCMLWDYGVATWASGVWQPVGFDNVYEDTDSMADLSNRRLLVRTPGLYRVSGQVSYQGYANGSRRLSIVAGSWVAASFWTPAPSDPCKLNASGYARLGYGAPIGLSTLHNSGTTLSSYPAEGSNWLAAEWISK